MLAVPPFALTQMVRLLRNAWEGYDMVRRNEQRSTDLTCASDCQCLCLQIRKLMLVGFLVVVGRGSVAQLFLALVISFASFALQVKLTPYR